MVSATLAAVGGSKTINIAKNIGGSILSGIQTVFGGGGNRVTPEKKAQREKITQYLRAYTTLAERREFILSTGSSLDRIKPTPEGMAYFYAGEDDFYHKNVGQNHQNFIDRLPGWIQQKADEKSQSVNNYSATSAASTGGGNKTVFAILGGITLLAFAFLGIRGQ